VAGGIDVSTPASLTVEFHLDGADMAAALRDDARRGLSAKPKFLPPKWFYDERGSELFDEITRLPEYYPTRREREILEGHASEVAAATGADTLVELGSGTSSKTRLLLDALARAGTLERFVPFDVSEATLLGSSAAIAKTYPGVSVHGVVGDFERHLALLPPGGRRLVAFLGGTIGNLEPVARATFLAGVASTMQPGDSLLLGTDLVKEAGRLEAAYDDPGGVTAAFNRNVLHVLNRELGADFVPERYAHVARWDPDREWIEMRLRAQIEQTVRIPAIDMVVDFAAGEQLRTEISAKFRQHGVEAELAAAGFELRGWWTDAAGDFALSLSFAG
jgi:L-histidine N-alpha-methyltransferase